MSNILNNIICGDSVEVLKTIPTDSVDIIITSPPYNFKKEYYSIDDNITWGDYSGFLKAVMIECYRVLKPSGRLCINIQPAYKEQIPTHHLVSSVADSVGLKWHSEIIWEKNTYACPVTAWGSYGSPSSPYLKATWEFIEVFYKDKFKKDGDKTNIDMSDLEFQQWTTPCRWSIAPERKMKEFGHPAMFPIEIPLRLMKLFSYKGDTVLDPFNGCGTTTLVAFLTGRQYIGIDISETYCETARGRIEEQATGLSFEFEEKTNIAKTGELPL